MRRDADLIRSILSACETASGPLEAPFDFDGFEEEIVSYHIHILEEAGLINAICRIYESGRVEALKIYRLTWAGHEFIDSARSERIWNEAKQLSKDKGLSLPFDVLKDLLQILIRQNILPA